jgi:hypothetical protein
MTKVIVNCTYCGNELERHKPSKTVFCSVQHKALYQKEFIVGSNHPLKGKPGLSGKDNPNFGNRWTEEQKNNQSEKIKKIMKDPERRWLSGTANRGKKFDEQRRRNISEGHKGEKNHFYGKTHSNEIRELIGIKSANKFKDPIFKEKFRAKMVELGYYISDENRSDWEIYRMQSDWIERMVDYFSEIQIKQLNEVKFFNPKTNTKGLVRDHALSRMEGFKLGIFPEIIRHPANCNLILHSENSSKRSECSITLEILFDKIQNFTQNWKEQTKCIELINAYQSGLRWNREYKVE